VIDDNFFQKARRDDGWPLGFLGRGAEIAGGAYQQLADNFAYEQSAFSFRALSNRRLKLCAEQHF